MALAKKWDIQIGASDTINKQFDDLKKAVKWLKRCNGLCSIVNVPQNREVFIGTPEQAINFIEARELTQ